MSEDEKFLYQLKEASILAIACSILICAAAFFCNCLDSRGPEILLALIIVAAAVVAIMLTRDIRSLSA